MAEFNSISLTALCADICDCMGIEPPKEAEKSQGKVKAMVGDRTCDRVVMYNPDAMAQWLVEKYPELYAPVAERCALSYPMATVMPSVTPVCFGTMYTGLYPVKHGIQKYEKPVLACETIFDTAIRQGKKCAIVANEKCSIGMIFLNRDMDYFLYPASAEGDEQVVQKGIELIKEDKYDLLVIYNGMYDSVMHATFPESEQAMDRLKHHVGAFTRIHEAVKEVNAASSHTTLVGFATDHGVHTNENGRGSHGKEIPEDINITHFYDVV
ncbi:MAG: alkaline phosphatase family protein [Clostridia bacterium]|nr:alkaline phosphatase family protein [Clostridia bacterium]